MRAYMIPIPNFKRMLHFWMRPALVGAEVLAEPGVAVTVGMGGAVFLP